MRTISRFTTIITVAFKRLLAQPGLALATLLGLVVSLSITLGIPTYTNAVYNRVLLEELSNRQDRFAEWRPPFSFLFGFLGSMVEIKEWEDIQSVDAYFIETAGRELGLPQTLLVRSFQTDNFQLFGQSESAYGGNPLEWINFGFLSGLEEHITLVEGGFPQPASMSAGDPVEVLISETLADRLGTQIGEMYFAYLQQATGDIRQPVEIPIRISGVWRPSDAQETYWFMSPASFEKALFVPIETLSGRLAGSLQGDIYTANWYLVMDGSGVDAAGALPLLNRIRRVKQTASRLLPQTILMTSPEDALQKFQGVTAQLTFTLYAYLLPILALLLSFLSLVVGLAVGQQHNEIAMLRSRGGTLFQVIVIAALQAFMLGALALLISLPVSMLVAQLIGRTRSFLDFGADTALRINLPQAALQAGFALVGLVILVQVMPTLGAAQHTIVTYKQERARMLRPPFWQRAWLDILLMIPAAYGAYLLREQGGLELPVRGINLTHDPFQNPLLFLVPTLGIFALTLFLVRILPLFMRLSAWLVSHTSGIGLLLATRHLSRTPGYYTTPLVLLVLTLSLSAFTASLAKTLDRHLIDQTYYQVGADASLQDLGEQFGGAPPGSSATPQTESSLHWFFLPVSEYLRLPGVQSVARVGVFNANVSLGTGAEESIFMGVDRVDFRQVAYWRGDFAAASLGALMNRLAVDPTGVLVCSKLMRKYGLIAGDTLQLSMYAGDTRRDMAFNIVGEFELFPTWYPTEGSKYLLVGNLENVFEQAGLQLPYNVWLKTDLNLNHAGFQESAANLGLNIIGLRDSPAEIRSEQQRPERQGLFGVLSVGFSAGALLTVLGFFLYALFSFRNRFIELGVLRAVGLSVEQMISFLAWELAFLLVIGLVAGTGLGVWVSRLFIPYLQIGTEATAQFPPYQVIIAWPEIYRIYALFGLLFVGALSVLGALLMRMKIFQAVKLGETV